LLARISRPGWRRLPILSSLSQRKPYGPSERVLAVLRGIGGERQPISRTEYDTLIGKLAVQHNVKPEQIVLAAGPERFWGWLRLLF